MGRPSIEVPIVRILASDGKRVCRLVRAADTPAGLLKFVKSICAEAGVGPEYPKRSNTSALLPPPQLRSCASCLRSQTASLAALGYRLFRGRRARPDTPARGDEPTDHRRRQSRVSRGPPSPGAA